MTTGIRSGIRKIVSRFVLNSTGMFMATPFWKDTLPVTPVSGGVVSGYCFSVFMGGKGAGIT
jgi:hypothetical protein